jgi:thiol-disulfide isomerase/thioredoxin
MKSFLLLSLFCAACGNGPGATDDMGTCDPANYACGPYGYGPGGVIQNLSFMGRSEANGNGYTDPTDPLKTISLADYYKNKGYKALVLLGVAEWCVPCRDEQPELVNLSKTYGNKVAWLEAVLQDAKSKPADQATADRWATDFKIPFDIVLDSQPVLAPFFDGNFPFSMVISTADMKISNQTIGRDLALKAHIDAIVN